METHWGYFASVGDGGLQAVSLLTTFAWLKLTVENAPQGIPQSSSPTMRTWMPGVSASKLGGRDQLVPQLADGLVETCAA